MINYRIHEINAWLREIEIKKGRKLRILHLGNIANNAYQNAVIMRRMGIECDVLCHDYYHIMACPEWEESDFRGIIKNQFHPNWTSVDTAGYIRPDWFVQGPFDLCIKYLIAKYNNNCTVGTRHWKWLGYYNKTREIKILDIPELVVRHFVYFIKRWFYALTDPDRVNRKLNEILGQINVRYRYLWKINKWIAPPMIYFCRFVSFLLLKMRKTAGLSEYDYEFNELKNRLIADYHKSFPDRKDRLTENDLYMFKPVLFYLNKIFTYFDLVIAYGTDPIYPMIANVPYFAIEHGTLREIPYHEDTIGRLTALSYHKAEFVFVTNIDCLKTARNLANDRIKVIPHPYDEKTSISRKYNILSVKKQLMEELHADFLLFHPTRHDWIAGAGYADKKNDIFLRAFSRLRENGLKVGVVCCEWGGNVLQSKLLLKKLKCSDYVKWLQPMGAIKYEQMILSADAVVDQFKLGAFGGVLFRSLTLGKPVCTYLDESLIEETYRVVPPVINCLTEDDIYRNLGSVLNDKKMLERLGILGKEWIEKYHSGDITAVIQLEEFRTIVSNN